MLCYDNSIQPSSQELLNSSHPRPRWINISIYQNKKCRKIFWYCNNYSCLNKTLMAFEIDPHDLWIPFVFTFPPLCFISWTFVGYSYKSIPFRTFHLFFPIQKSILLGILYPNTIIPTYVQIHRLMVQSSQFIVHIFQRFFWNPKFCLSSDWNKSWDSTIKKQWKWMVFSGLVC